MNQKIISELSLILLSLVVIAIPVSAVNITMQNRSINLSNNINYIVSVEASSIPMSAIQVTFNYDPGALQVNWVRQGNFLYYAKDDAKIWQVWNNKTAGKITVVSMVMFDFSILQNDKSTLMTINMKPLRKVTTRVNLSAGAIVGGLDSPENVVGEMGRNYTIKVT